MMIAKMATAETKLELSHDLSSFHEVKANGLQGGTQVTTASHVKARVSNQQYQLTTRPCLSTRTSVFDNTVDEVSLDAVHGFPVLDGQVIIDDTSSGRLGGGTNGNVFRGLWKGQQVAVKMSSPGRSSQAASRMLLEEAQGLHFLRGVEGVIKCHGVITTPATEPVDSSNSSAGDDASRLISGIVVELCSGGDLQDFLDDYRHYCTIKSRKDMYFHMTDVEMARLMLEVVRVVKEMHHHGAVHMDLKPANIAIHINSDHNVELKIIDIGNAIPTGEEVFSLWGTPGFCSPEAAAATIDKPHTVSPTDDIFSLGQIMLDLLGMNMLQAALRTYHSDAPDLEITVDMLAKLVADGETIPWFDNEQEMRLFQQRGVSPRLIEILKGCLHADASCRITAADLEQALLSFIRCDRDAFCNSWENFEAVVVEIRDLKAAHQQQQPEHEKQGDVGVQITRISGTGCSAASLAAETAEIMSDQEDLDEATPRYVAAYDIESATSTLLATISQSASSQESVEASTAADQQGGVMVMMNQAELLTAFELARMEQQWHVRQQRRKQQQVICLVMFEDALCERAMLQLDLNESIQLAARLSLCGVVSQTLVDEISSLQSRIQVCQAIEQQAMMVPCY